MENTRSIPASRAGLTRNDLPRLRLKWAFLYPDSVETRSQPTIVGDSLFVGSQSGTVYAMSARTGCTHWTFSAAGEIRGSIVYRAQMTHSPQGPRGTPTLFFGDAFANVYAIDAVSGSLRWKIRVDDHPVARIVGTPVLSGDRLYVPTGSWGEEIAAATPDYVCCTFRGSITALDRSTGAVIWKRYTIAAAATEQYRNSLGKPDMGPSGAGVWSSPALDESRHAIYFTTGNNYSDPPDDNSDAIFSIDAATGHVNWKRQATAQDTYNDGCEGGRREATCPRKAGADVDFTAPPILVRDPHGHDILLAGQKSGDAYGLDPDTGKQIWHTRISRDANPMSGGIWFGMVVQDGRLIIPAITLSPKDAPPGPPDQGINLPSPTDGLHALNAFTGRLLWSTSIDPHCNSAGGCAAVFAAPLAIPGAVFAGTVDGYIRAFDTHSGHEIWSFNTAQTFKSISGDVVSGGVLIGAGEIMVGRGMVYVNTSRPEGSASALLAFAVR